MMFVRKKESIKSLCSQSLKAQRGSVLVLVVWVFSLLSVFVVGLSSKSTFALDLSSRLNGNLETHYAARSAIPYVMAVLDRDMTRAFDAYGEEWYDSTALFSRKVMLNTYFSIWNEHHDPFLKRTSKRYGLQDEESKFNINTMPAEILESLFMTVADMDEGMAIAVVQAIIDWRDEDSDKGSVGAERQDYLGLGNPYEIKDGPFQSTEELLLVKGMTPQLYEFIEPYVTAYGTGRLNLNTIHEKSMLTLGITEIGVNAILFYRSGSDGIEGTSDDAPFSSISAVIGELENLIPIQDIQTLTKLQGKNIIGVTSFAYSFTIEGGLLDSDEKVLVDCILDRSGNILKWSER